MQFLSYGSWLDCFESALIAFMALCIIAINKSNCHSLSRLPFAGVEHLVLGLTAPTPLNDCQHTNSGGRAVAFATRVTAAAAARSPAAFHLVADGA